MLTTRAHLVLHHLNVLSISRFHPLAASTTSGIAGGAAGTRELFTVVGGRRVES